MDDASLAIIEALRQDGRRSYAAIAREVGLSETTVRARLQQLIGSGVLRIVAVTDPLQLGLQRQALIGIGCEDDVPGLAEQLAQLPEVVTVAVTTGAFDIVAEVLCTDDQHLLNLLNERIRKLPGVNSTETLVYLEVHKRPADRG